LSIVSFIMRRALLRPNVLSILHAAIFVSFVAGIELFRHRRLRRLAWAINKADAFDGISVLEQLRHCLGRKRPSLEASEGVKQRIAHLLVAALQPRPTSPAQRPSSPRRQGPPRSAPKAALALREHFGEFPETWA
jgi:hypothetical protein